MSSGSRRSRPWSSTHLGIAALFLGGFLVVYLICYFLASWFARRVVDLVFE